jgi:hypothetical protein
LGNPSSRVNSLVLCTIPDEQLLLREHERLELRGIRAILFREPDRNNEATALCTEPIPKSKRRLFSKWKLWEEMCHA